MSRNFSFKPAVAAAMLLASSVMAAAGTWSVTDAVGRKVEIADTSRIVTIGGAVT